MKQCLHYLKIFTVVLVLVMAASAVNAQTRTASVDGNWNNIATWGGASVPTSVNDVIINNGIMVTVNVPAACASITIGNTDAAGGVTISGTNSLAVTNGVIIGDLLDNTSGITIAVGAGTFSCSSITMADVTLSNDDISLTVSTGTATISGDIVMNGIVGENLVSVTGAGMLNIGGAISATNGALTAANTSTVNYNGADQNVRATTYGNLNLSGTGTKTQGGLIVVNTNLAIVSGVTLDVTGFNFSVGGTTSVSGTLTHSSATGAKTYTGNVTINNGGIWNDDAAVIAIAFAGNLQNDGTFNAGTGAHSFSAGSKTFSGANTISIPNVTISGTRTNNGTLTTSTLTVNANMTNNGTLTAGTVLAGTNTLTQGANAVLNIGGTSTINALTAPVNPNTVNYTGAGQTIKAATYHHLNVTGSATAGGIMDLNGNLTIASGATLNGSTFAHMIAGNWINNGGTYSSTGTVTFNGTGKSIGGTAPTTFNNLTLDGNGTTTLAINTDVAGNLNVTTNDILDLSTFSCNRTAAGGALTVAGTLKLSGINNFPLNYATKTLTGTVNYNNASGGQTIFPTTYSTLTLGNTSGTQTAGGNLIVTTLNNNTNAADILDMSTNTLTVTTINNTGTIKTQSISATPLSTGRTWGGTVEYNGVNQTAVAGTYNNFIASGGGTKTTAAALDVNGNLTIESGTTLNGSTFTHTIAGNWINNGGTYTSTGTVTFNGITQTIGGTSSTTFNILALNGSPTTTTLAVNTSVAGNLTLSTGDVLNLSTFSCNRTAAGGTMSLASSSIVKLSGTSGGPAGSNFPLNFTTYTLSGTVNYNSASGGQTIYSTPSYGTLTLGNTSGTQIAGDNLTVSTLNNNTNAANVLDMGVYNLTVTTVNNTATIKTQSASATPLSSGRTWGGVVQFNGAGQTLVGGTFTNILLSGVGPFTLTAATALDVKGNWTKNSAGAFIPSTGTITFNGTALQTIGGSDATSFGKIVFNNNSGISLGKSATIVTSATFTNGAVNTSATNLLTFDAGATSGASSNSSFVNGPVRKIFNNAEAFVFPVGVTGTGNEPLTVDGITAAGYDFTAEYSRISATSLSSSYNSPIQFVSGCEHWNLDKNAGPAAGVNVTLSWDANSGCNGNPYVTNPGTLSIGVLNGGTWDEAGLAGTFSTSTAKRTAITLFGAFTLANVTGGSENSLPVMFNNVKAYEKNNGVEIDWTNLTERDLLNYIVERSANGVNFTGISQQLPRSNQNDKESYSAFDATPFSGINFYRIKVLEISGKVIYSKVIRVEIAKAVQGFGLYPNPVKGNQISLLINNRQGQYTMKVFNTAGLEIFSQRIVHQGGSMTQTVDLPSTIKAGVYNMLISGDNYREAKMFVVQ